MKKIAIIGAHTNARVIYYMIKKYNLFEVACFAVDKEYLHGEKEYLGLPLIAIDELPKYISKETDYVFIGVLWNNLNSDRRHLYEKMKCLGYKFVNVISPTAVIQEEVKLGENILICDNAIIECNTSIGDDTYIHGGAFVSESCNIGRHCFLGIKSLTAGAVTLGDQCFVGVGATLFDEVKIGEKCVIGARTIIKRHLPSYSMVKTKTSELQVIEQLDADSITGKIVAGKNIR